MPDERTYPAGVPCWIDTDQPDVDAASNFYAGWFGWTLTDAVPPELPGPYLERVGPLTSSPPTLVPAAGWQARGRLGAQVANVPGAWNFSDLHSTDPVAAQSFYAPLFGPE